MVKNAKATAAAPELEAAEPQTVTYSRGSNYRKGALTKRYQLPKGCSVREVVIRELCGNDELEAALWTERHADAALLETPQGQIAAEQREMVRLSLVEVDGAEVNVDGVPYMGLDTWSVKTFRAVRLFFNDINSLDGAQLKSALEGAQVVVGHAPGKGSDD